MDVLSFGDVLDIPSKTIDSAGNTFNNTLNTMMNPINNLTKSIGDLLGGLNPNMILLGLGGIAIFIYMKK